VPEQLLTGWGRTAPTRADVRELSMASDRAIDEAVADALRDAGQRGVLCRGLGRSYNDAAQNAGGTVLRLPVDAARHLDEATGLLTCGGGARLCDLMADLVPLGWFPPVTPGTSMVTVGGMLAADVHGKNHHRDGSIGRHVRSLDVVTPAHGVMRLTPEGDRADWFWATIGGMGMTGVIVRATLALLRIPSPLIRSVETRHRDLDDLMAGLQDADARRYSVAWVDGTARGRRFGRGLVTAGEHADKPPGGPSDRRPRIPQASAGTAVRPPRPRFIPDDGNAPADLPSGPRRVSGTRVTVPLTPPVTPLNRWTVAAFNEAWYHKPGTGEHLTSLRSFFHPLDGVSRWNRIYGPRGFVQYQFVVPDAAAGLVPVALAALQEVGATSFLSVLKRFGPGSPAPLSFPAPGWTLALDVPAGVPGLARVLDDLDVRVAAAGGRIYLAKDGRARREVVAAMYPRLDQWRRTRAQMDPDGVLRSDLARRLGL
jgi:decaprenylphospho-beta-D-ribofuranose 2-oxidase